MQRWAPPAVFSKKGVIHSVDLRDEERLWPPRDLPHSVGTRQAAAVPAPFGVLIQALSKEVVEERAQAWSGVREIPGNVGSSRFHVDED